MFIITMLELLENMEMEIALGLYVTIVPFACSLRYTIRGEIFFHLPHK